MSKDNAIIAYALYRVSTKGQVDKVKDDIPMQREACHEFADRMGWTIGKEFLEKGVSGFKVSAKDRDAIQDLKDAALKGEFQVLLVFMFDRIGRIDDETPFIVEWFAKHGIKVWSVNEGEQRFESHVDKLMNYIRFWQAAGESEKTSMRIKTRMQQLTAEGIYRGGPVPFGYMLENRGRLNKKGKPSYDLAVNPEEAEWVRVIFEKTVKNGYGSFRIAEYLNKQGVKTHNDSKFQCNTVLRILRNKLYCGYMVSGETVSPQLKELQIIDEMMFEQAQHILDEREKKNDENRKIAYQTKSSALLSGIMYCAHCGGKLTAISHTDRRTRKDGSVYEFTRAKYLCYHKSRGLCECDGQSSYLAYKVDDAVVKAIENMFASITDSPDEKVLKKHFTKEMQSYKAKQTKLKLDISKLQKQHEKLEKEIATALTGESAFTPEQLSKVIDGVENQISEQQHKLDTLNTEMTEKKASMESVKPLYDRFKNWAEEFADSTMEQKKMIIAELVDRIEVGRDYKVSILLNMTYQQFCDSWNTVNTVSTVKA